MDLHQPGHQNQHDVYDGQGECHEKGDNNDHDNNDNLDADLRC